MGRKIGGAGMAILLILLLVLAVRYALSSLETAPAQAQPANIEKVRKEMKQIQAKEETQLKQVDDSIDNKATSDSK